MGEGTPVGGGGAGGTRGVPERLPAPSPSAGGALGGPAPAPAGFASPSLPSAPLRPEGGGEGRKSEAEQGGTPDPRGQGLSSSQRLLPSRAQQCLSQGQSRPACSPWWLQPASGSGPPALRSVSSLPPWTGWPAAPSPRSAAKAWGEGQGPGTPLALVTEGPG